MKYMLLMYAKGSENPTPTPEEYQTWAAFGQEISAAGVVLSNTGLAPTADATTIRVRNGKTLTIDGPFAETHEVLAGYYLLECKDLDEAIRWAEKIPMAKYGSIEVRPEWRQKS
jgi:hypothetical protein